MSYRRAIVSFAGAALLAVAAAWTAQRLLERPAAPAQAVAVATEHVVVARADLSVGAKLAARQLSRVEWPAHLLPRGTFARPEAQDGRVLRRALAAGEPVLASALLPEGHEGGLLAVIQETRRAVSVKVDPTIGVAGFVVPGSRVDVLATLRRAGRGRAYSKVILQDVPVLAIDQRLEKVDEGEPELVNVVTLEVSPAEAERLIYGSHEGRLQLALRSPEDRARVATRPVSAADLLAGGAPATSRRRSVGVQILKGNQLSSRAF